MNTNTLIDALRAGTAALPLLLLSGAALAQPDVAVDDDFGVEDGVADEQAYPELRLHEPVRGAFEQGDIATPDGLLVDPYDVQLQADVNYRVEIVGDGCTALVYVVNNDGSPIRGLVFEADATGVTFRVNRSGMYGIGTMTAEPDTAGRYTLSLERADAAPTPIAGQEFPVNVPDAPGVEEADGLDDGPDVGMPEDYPGATMIQDQLDADDTLLDDGRYFAFHAVDMQGGTTYHIDVASDAVDVIGYLFDAENNQIDTNDDAPGMGTNARMTFTPDADGTYSVGVSSVKPGRTGGYQVTVAPVGGAAETDADASGTQEYNVLYHAEGEASDEQNYYAGDFRLEQGQRVVIETYNLSDGCDTVLQLRRSTDPERVSADDPVVAENDDDNGSLSSRIVYTAEEAGDYYLAVGVYDGAAGTFNVVVREALPAREPIVIEGIELEKDGQVLLGDFELEEALNWLVIETYDLSQGVDTVIELRKTVDPERASDDDPVLATNDDVGSALRSMLYFQCEDAGLYYIRITNIGKNAGTCSFAITFQE